MKTRLVLSILLCVITLPALAALTPQDLDKIRLIVKDELKSEITAVKQELKADIAAVKQELKAEITENRQKIQEVDQGVSWIRGKLDGIDRQTAWLIALIIVSVCVPQLVVIWRSRKERFLERQLETLAQDIETLKQQQIANP